MLHFDPEKTLPDWRRQRYQFARPSLRNWSMLDAPTQPLPDMPTQSLPQQEPAERQPTVPLPPVQVSTVQQDTQPLPLGFILRQGLLPAIGEVGREVRELREVFIALQPTQPLRAARHRLPWRQWLSGVVTVTATVGMLLLGVLLPTLGKYFPVGGAMEDLWRVFLSNSNSYVGAIGAVFSLVLSRGVTFLSNPVEQVAAEKRRIASLRQGRARAFVKLIWRQVYLSLGWPVILATIVDQGAGFLFADRLTAVIYSRTAVTVVILAIKTWWQGIFGGGLYILRQGVNFDRESDEERQKTRDTLLARASARKHWWQRLPLWVYLIGTPVLLGAFGVGSVAILLILLGGYASGTNPSTASLAVVAGMLVLNNVAQGLVFSGLSTSAVWLVRVGRPRGRTEWALCLKTVLVGLPLAIPSAIAAPSFALWVQGLLGGGLNNSQQQALYVYSKELAGAVLSQLVTAYQAFATKRKRPSLYVYGKELVGAVLSQLVTAYQAFATKRKRP
jgi:hypothetical protein